MDLHDIRWQQRFINYKKAFQQLKQFVATWNLNDMDKQGLIKAFELAYELSLKTLQAKIINCLYHTPIRHKKLNLNLNPCFCFL